MSSKNVGKNTDYVGTRNNSIDLHAFLNKPT